ncbi:nickel pincer cofactor biosynthesis protein LarB [Ammoniphilus sp. YIM 78166]|uniref:nickel pincer cofactor biosynthesis protein LarB n=1 Tax=Ammoniphilus sp. YIM 78166 TaxID=1644106 RepID=UPI00106F6EC7|nr:nickel pincer cofactor biosynthesis protein LarB [Ammoniphilus sp. YIM 78166]
MSEQLRWLLKKVAEGQLDPGEAYDELKRFEDLGFVKIDQHRKERKGFPEVIYGESKTAVQITRIFESMMNVYEVVLATRVSPEKAEEILCRLPRLKYCKESKTLLHARKPLEPQYQGTVGILCAGTSDLPVAKEAVVTAQAMGNPVKEFYDIGVAGIHRLFHHLDDIKTCRVLICIAGMEAALPSVVGGLCHQPIIAVPTSVGYGSHFGGVTALLSMLNSCSSGITVVNIDNGFGAAYAATLINRLGEGVSV